MTPPRFREEAVIFTGTLYASREVYEACRDVLRSAFGEILFEAPALPWTFSDYYREETGDCLQRNFLFFSPVVDSSILPDVKIRTMEIERLFSIDRKRTINLDPGYLSLAKVVLATRKNYSHRIHLGKSVFAELELIYQGGAFHAMPYSYHDYRESSFVSHFTHARNLLKGLVDARNGKIRRDPAGRFRAQKG